MGPKHLAKFKVWMPSTQRTSGVCVWKGHMLAGGAFISNPGTSKKTNGTWTHERDDKEDGNEIFKVKEYNRSKV